MDADWSVELGADDPVLEIPWSDPDERLRYRDIKRNPETLLYVDEANTYRELGEFLAAVNSRSSLLETAKCDVWVSDEISEAEEIYDASTKFCSYVDVLFTADSSFESLRADFTAHEAFAKRAVKLLQTAPEMSTSAEFIVRRCLFREENVDGFYVTFYLCGYGDDELDARRRWAIALALVQNALLQISAEMRRLGTL